MANRQEQPRIESGELLHGQGTAGQIETVLDRLDAGYCRL